MGREARLRREVHAQTAGAKNYQKHVSRELRRQEVDRLVETSTYYHEAAHHIVAQHLGLKGEIHWTPPKGAPADWRAAHSHEPGTDEQNARISLAGEVVEEIFDSRLLDLGAETHREGVDKDGMTDDMKHAMHHCLRATGGDVERATEMANRLLIETRQLVLDKWGEIAEIAQKGFEECQAEVVPGLTGVPPKCPVSMVL